MNFSSNVSNYQVQQRLETLQKTRSPSEKAAINKAIKMTGYNIEGALKKNPLLQKEFLDRFDQALETGRQQAIYNKSVNQITDQFKQNIIQWEAKCAEIKSSNKALEQTYHNTCAQIDTEYNEATQKYTRVFRKRTSSYSRGAFTSRTQKIQNGTTPEKTIPCPNP